MKLQRTSAMRESLTSSEFSSRNSKHTTKTTSPYSSSNSLNSMDSSGVHYTRAKRIQPTSQTKVAAPPRKKRAAPRPPSQMAIPEKSPLIVQNGGEKVATPTSPLSNKDFSVSTPNLTSSTLLHSDINGNDCNGHLEDIKENGSVSPSNGYTEQTVLYAQVQKKNALNLNSSNSVDNLAVSPSPSLLDGDNNNKYPEPSPRKKVVPVPKKKTVAPPAPPPRGSAYSDDNESLASTNLSSEPCTPVVLATPLQDFTMVPPKPAERELSREDLSSPVSDLPTPQPRVTTTSTTLLNATDLKQDLKNFETDSGKLKTVNNVSKVMLNRTPTPEPRSLSCEPPDMDVCYETQLENLKGTVDDDNVSKQADSGIGEPVPSPIPDSLPSEVSILDVKSNFESSSDDDDMVKVYNFKLGKTLVKPLNETKTLEELTIMNAGHEETDSELNTPLTQISCSATPSETSSWNFAIPISPPPNFADTKFSEAFVESEKQEQENPITPKIMERPVLNFEVLKQEEPMKPKPAEKPVTTSLVNTPTTPLDNIVGELSAIIQDKGLDTLIKKSEEVTEIKAAKPNTLTNFTISSGTSGALTKPKEVQREKAQIEEFKVEPLADSPTNAPDEEKLYRKRNSVTSLKQRRSITRSDSFHTTAIATEISNTSSNSLNKRTSSQLSLDQMADNLNRRRSSSELSIGESPSLQSLEVMKTILNSRKNSLAHSGAEEESIEVNTRRPSDEIKFSSLELRSKLAVEKTQQEIKQEIHESTSKTEGKSERSFNNSSNEEKKLDDKLSAVEVKLENTTKAKVEDKLEESSTVKAEQKLEESSTVKVERKLEDKPKELPTIYRYSGPPSINFSTWSERPKVQVAIMNEGDYIFGGKANDSQTVPRSYRMSTPANFNEDSATKIQPPVAPKPAIIQRMGIPEKDYKVPVLVKPLRDVIVESTEAVTTATKEDVATSNQSPAPETVQKTQISLKTITNGDTNVGVQKPPTPVKTIPNGGLKLTLQRPTVESVLKPQTQTIVNTATLPRTNKRFSTQISAVTTTSTTPVTPGPQLLRSTSTKREDKDMKPFVASANAPVTPGPQLLRSTSTKREERQTKSMVIVDDKAAPAAPFGQNTLRRTGFKEKMMAQEEEDKQKAINLSAQATAKTPTPPAKALTNGEAKFTTSKPPTSAKLHLNLQKSTSITVTVNGNGNGNGPSSPVTPVLKPKPQTPKTAPVQTTTTTSPPPPPVMINLKPVTVVHTPRASEDPRDQLMDAIRNFKKDELKKS